MTDLIDTALALHLEDDPTADVVWHSDCRNWFVVRTATGTYRAYDPHCQILGTLFVLADAVANCAHDMDRYGVAVLADLLPPDDDGPADLD